MSWATFDPEAREVAERVLTDRQLEVLQLRADGHGPRWIAQILDVAPSTVKDHLLAVKKALTTAGLVEGADGCWFCGWPLLQTRQAAVQAAATSSAT